MTTFHAAFQSISYRNYCFCGRIHSDEKLAEGGLRSPQNGTEADNVEQHYE
jgi:hypothetical protein